MAEQPSFKAELRAMAREAVNDTRSTIHEVFFGKGEHMPEMGTPMHPTPQMVTNDLLQDDKMSLDEMRVFADERAKAAEDRMDRGHEREMER